SLTAHPRPQFRTPFLRKLIPAYPPGVRPTFPSCPHGQRGCPKAPFAPLLPCHDRWSLASPFLRYRQKSLWLSADFCIMISIERTLRMNRLLVLVTSCA